MMNAQNWREIEMSKTTILKVKKLLVLLALIIVTLACNLPDVRDMVEEAAFEKCYPADRATYERAAAELGQIPETPKYPEAAVYEVCFAGEERTDEMTSERMSDGYGRTEDEDANSIPAGTYIGDNGEIPPDWELVEGEFIINVAEDGTVSGSRIYIIRRESVGPTCTWRWENGHTTIINGHVSGTAGYVTVENDSYTISDGSECGGSNNHQTFESVCDEAQITISGDQLEIIGDGSSNCGFVFSATKP